MLNCIYVDSQIDSPNISKFTRESLDFSFEQLTIMHAFIIEGFMIYEVYNRIDKKEDFKYQLIGFILMLPVWYLTIAFEV